MLCIYSTILLKSSNIIPLRNTSGIHILNDKAFLSVDFSYCEKIFYYRRKANKQKFARIKRILRKWKRFDITLRRRV